MADFPSSPISPSEFLERWFPAAFAAADPPAGAQDVAVKLGVKLDGDGGGEWLFHIQGASMKVESGSAESAAFTFVQSVVDWRGALWEGRGGAIGKGAAQMFRPGEETAAAGQMGGAPPASALAEMEKLSGVIRMLVAGGEGGDWKVDFKLGPGEIPAEPTTTITVTAEDAAAMESGELDPMTAFMSGRMQVAGDMTLMMQMQAIQMQAQAAAQAAARASEGASEEESS